MRNSAEARFQLQEDVVRMLLNPESEIIVQKEFPAEVASLDPVGRRPDAVVAEVDFGLTAVMSDVDVHGQEDFAAG